MKQNRRKIVTLIARGAGVLIAFVSTFTHGSPAPAKETDLWTAHIQPILSQNCFKCHSDLKAKSGLDLTTLSGILKGGERGSAIIPGKPDKSPLFQFIQPGADPHMPPKDHQLSEDEIALIKRWINSFKDITGSATNQSSGSWDSADYSWVRSNTPAKPPMGSVTGPAAIDFYLRNAWKAARIKPAARADDATFARRIYLDLAGRIPKTDELQAFLKERKSDKRARLVDHLLETPDYAQNMAEIFNVLLTGKRSTDEAWNAYLRYAFSTNRPWDQIARDLLLARPASKELRGSVFFLHSRNNNHQAMAEAVAPPVFGVQMHCAQCHNHPLAPEIKQKHYWGLVAFFNRSKNVQTSDGPAIGESAIGGFIKFANLKKESQDALLTFVDNTTVAEQRPGENEKENDSADKYRIAPDKKLAAVPKFSRREEFAELATRHNPLLARAFVNRIWSMLLGRGIVHPADRMDSTHPASHPDLLLWLAGNFEQNGYNVRRLLRTICLSEVYQLDSKWTGASKPQPELFAFAIEKPLRAEQLLRSMLIASGRPAASAELQNAFGDRFPDVLAPESMPNLRQALFLSNNGKFTALLARADGNTTDALLKTSDLRERVDQLFTRVLGRHPDREERKEAEEFLRSHAKEPQRALQDLLWALLASPEFRFNH